MAEHLPPIPDDLATCQAQLRVALEQHAALLQRFHDLERQLDEIWTTTEQLQRSYACLKEEFLALKRLPFGPRRERLREAAGQGHLFDTATAASLLPEPTASHPSEPEPAKHRMGHGRRPIGDHLSRRDVLHDVSEDQRTCPCGRAKTKIGEDVTEQLDYTPGTLEVLRHIYPKYACSCCKDGVVTAPTASGPIAGGLAATGLLAHVLVSKFIEHMPLYRQQDELARAGILISRSTLCGWLEQCAQLFKPLVELMHKEVLRSEVIQGDETPVPVLDRSRDSTRKGYIWTTIGDRAHPYTSCHYTDSRSRDGPAAFLKGYIGYLQTDAYASYESVVKESAGKIIAVGCWAHVRREFFDARRNQPREVHYVLGLIAQLYDVEDEVRGRGDAERLAARQERSLPVLKRLREYLREQLGRASKESVRQGDQLRAESVGGAAPVSER
jgi:transposase